MNTNDAVEAFKQLGWMPKRNIDLYAEKEIGDRVVQILFKIKNLGTYQQFEASHALKSNDFSAAVKEVEGGRDDCNDMLKVDFKSKTCFREPEITRMHVEAVCRKAVEWAMSVDIQERYEELCELDPSIPGAAGVWHLAALALKRRTDKLASYQERFEAGDNCGFVDFITRDYIDCAVAMVKPGRV